jgi:hypothetical protein
MGALSSNKRQKMLLDGSCEPYREQIEPVLKIFWMLAPDAEGLPCTLKVTADIRRDLLLLSPGADEAQAARGRLTDFNGVLIPCAPGDSFTILISERQFTDLSYVHTLAHELAHLHDYSRFFRESGYLNEKGREEQEKAHFWEFYVWAEFHARRVGVWFRCMHSWCGEHGLDIPPDGRLPMTISFHAKDVEDAVDRLIVGRSTAAANDLLWKLIIELAWYYARLSLDESIGPDSIPDSAFPRQKLARVLGEPALELFALLRRMRTYDEAIPLLPSLDALFGKITSKLNEGLPWRFPWPDLINQISTTHAQMLKAVEAIGKSTSGSMAELVRRQAGQACGPLDKIRRANGKGT